MYKLTVFLLIFLTVSNAFGDVKTDIKGTIEWDTLQIKAAASLDLSSAGIKIPSGRTQGEAILNSEYLRLIQSSILELQVDSSSTIADLINRGEFSLLEAEALMLMAQSIPPALSTDLKKMTVSYTLTLSNISASLLRHTRPYPITRTLNPVSSAQYTGIIIIACESLPVYGMKGTTLPIPCLFPKIWDNSMNLVFEKNMLEAQTASMLCYSPMQSIFQKNPSGLSAELQAIVGQKPLRIFACGVFGSKPTDLIIDRNDALLIISSEENRRLLMQGKVAVILDDSVLRCDFTGN
jgi:hypothetical protein